jgi:hypothetical protein
MAALSDYLENALIDHLFRDIQHAKPTQLNIGLFTGAPSDSGGGTEVTGGSYARVNHAPGSTNWRNTQNSGTGASSGTTGVTANLTTITFPTPTANWGVVTHFGIFDQSGNLLAQGALTVQKTINNGDPAPTFPAGTFTFTLA